MHIDTVGGYLAKYSKIIEDGFETWSEFFGVPGLPSVWSGCSDLVLLLDPRRWERKINLNNHSDEGQNTTWWSSHGATQFPNPIILGDMVIGLLLRNRFQCHADMGAKLVCHICLYYVWSSMYISYSILKTYFLPTIFASPYKGDKPIDQQCQGAYLQTLHQPTNIESIPWFAIIFPMIFFSFHGAVPWPWDKPIHTNMIYLHDPTYI